MKHFLLDTDVLLDYLQFKGPKMGSQLVDFMQKGICFTTVLNASELLVKSKTKKQKEAALNLLYGIKVIGLNSRYSLEVPTYAGKFKEINQILFFIVALRNKLIIVTKKPGLYKRKGVPVVKYNSQIK